MKKIRMQALLIILLIDFILTFLIVKISIFTMKPYMQEMYDKLTTTDYKGVISMGEISMLMLVLNIRFLIGLSVSSLLMLLFLLRLKKYYWELLFSYLILFVVLVALVRFTH
ncbi:hypothetical protein DVR12_01910 [Chitinophaga silvatica]|uniref:Uncharacterized protein n=1 Tax=Chitinophaga silvatica TaxID=2282649 RepID=A0A3E1YGL8_9BACT|nr:hypothetical protein DVR12_01910 [Chitinophaga silvatica]